MKAGEIQHFESQEGEKPFYVSHLPSSDFLGVSKGIKQVLWERGLWKEGMTKDGGHEHDKELSMIYVLGNQKDFADVVPSLKLLVEGRHRGVCLMLPKYHCELNPIELVWGRTKHWLRKVCTHWQV